VCVEVELGGRHSCAVPRSWGPLQRVKLQEITVVLTLF
jgi:hypothetical protein